MSNKEFFKHLIDRFYLNQYIKNINIDFLIGKDENEITLLSKKIYNFDIQLNISKLIYLLKKFNIQNVKVKDINYAFYLYKYNHAMLDKKKDSLIKKDIYNKLQNNLIGSAIKLIDYLNIFDIYDDYCILKLCNRIKRYIKNLSEWENADKFYLIDLYSENYYELQNLKSRFIKLKNKNKKDLEEIDKIDKKQKDILRKIYDLDGFERFKNIKPKIRYNSLEYKKNIEDEYWNLIENDLKYYPIKYNFTYEHIIYLKEMLISIFSFDKETLKEIEENIITEIELIDSYYIISDIKFLFKVLKKIQLEDDIENTELFYNNFITNIIEGNDLINFVPLSLKYITESFLKKKMNI